MGSELRKKKRKIFTFQKNSQKLFPMKLDSVGKRDGRNARWKEREMEGKEEIEKERERKRPR